LVGLGCCFKDIDSNLYFRFEVNVPKEENY
jgi:hypothetical protein